MKGQRERIRLPPGHSFRVLRWQRSLAEVDMVTGPGQFVRIRGEGLHWHYHTEMELTLFTSGEGTRFVGDHIGPFAAGDLVLIGERVPHHWLTRGASAGVSVQWTFAPEHGLWTIPEAGELAALFTSAGRGLHITGPAATAVRVGLRDVLEGAGLERLAALLRILASLNRAARADARPLSAKSFALPAGSAHQSGIQEAVRHLTLHFREEVRLEDLLRLTGMSKPTFSRQFKRHAGRTFTDFLSGIRLEAACRDLRETDRPVTDIAHGAGFSQISFFNRLFQRRQTCSPREYRARSATPCQPESPGTPGGEGSFSAAEDKVPSRVRSR